MLQRVGGLVFESAKVGWRKHADPLKRAPVQTEKAI